MVVEQLRSAGMIEAIRISRAAYPYRLTYIEFMQRFRSLKSRQWHEDQRVRQLKGGLTKTEEQNKDSCEILLGMLMPSGPISSGNFKSKMYEFGFSRVYFSSGVLEKLEGLRNKAIFLAVCSVQKCVRGYRQRRTFLQMREAVMVVQTRVRTWNAVTKFKKIICAVVKMQSIGRKFLCRCLANRMRMYNGATRIQAEYRMLKERKIFIRCRRAAILLESIAKMRCQRRKFIEMRDKARRLADLQERLMIYEVWSTQQYNGIIIFNLLRRNNWQRKSLHVKKVNAQLQLQWKQKE